MHALFARLRPVDFLPLIFLSTVAVLSLMTPHPLRLDGDTLAAWAIFTVVWTLIVALPSVVRFDRSFVLARYSNLPGHAILIVLAVTLLFTRSFQSLLDPVAVAIVGLLCVLIYGVGRHHRQFTAREFLYRWSPLIISFYIYSNLRWFVSSLNPRIMDDFLAQLDLALFGVHLTLVLERFQTPWLTEWFSFHYSAYVLYPVVTGLLFYYRGQNIAFEDFILAFGLSMYLGFLGYLMVPAIGPLSGLIDQYTTTTVPGMNLSQYRETIVIKYRYIRDAFPSLHTANSLICVGMLWRHAPRIFWLFLFGEVNLLISTLYLRMHYTVDVVAGVILAALTLYAAPRLNRWAGVPRPEKPAIPTPS